MMNCKEKDFMRDTLFNAYLNVRKIQAGTYGDRVHVSLDEAIACADAIEFVFCHLCGAEEVNKIHEAADKAVIKTDDELLHQSFKDSSGTTILID